MQKFKFYDDQFNDVEMEEIVANLREETKLSARRDANYLYSSDTQEEDTASLTE